MRIHLTVADDAAERSLVNLVRLFADEPVVTFGPEPDPEADFAVRLEAAETGGTVRASAAFLRRAPSMSGPFRMTHPRSGAAKSCVRR